MPIAKDGKHYLSDVMVRQANDRFDAKNKARMSASFEQENRQENGRKPREPRSKIMDDDGNGFLVQDETGEINGPFPRIDAALAHIAAKRGPVGRQFLTSQHDDGSYTTHAIESGDDQPESREHDTLESAQEHMKQTFGGDSGGMPEANLNSRGRR